jgi:hypothetical protein
MPRFSFALKKGAAVATPLKDNFTVDYCLLINFVYKFDNFIVAKHIAVIVREFL